MSPTEAQSRSGSRPVEAGGDDWLRRPTRLWSWPALLAEGALPPSPGVYGWYFLDLPATVPVSDCHTLHGWTLAYVGIAPRPPTRAGRASSQNLAKRLRMHFGGTAFGSTLRFSLGCLLAGQLGLEYRRFGRSLGFGRTGETALSAWMHDHARVALQVHDEPWLEEERCIGALSLPLNLKGNEQHPFHPALSLLRRTAAASARVLPALAR